MLSTLLLLTQGLALGKVWICGKDWKPRTGFLASLDPPSPAVMLRAIRDHEEDICKLFLATVADLASITVHGVTDVKQVLTHLSQTLGRLVSGRRPSA